MMYQELIQVLSGGPVKLSLCKLDDVPPKSGNFYHALEDIHRQHSRESNFIVDGDWRDVDSILHQVHDRSNHTLLLILCK